MEPLKRIVRDLLIKASDGASRLVYGTQDFVESGLGIPALMTQATALSVAACGCAGAAELVLDVGRKVYGRRECKHCTGWGGMRCTSCKGTGRIQYLTVNPRGSSAEYAAKAIVEGETELKKIPTSMDVGYTLPSLECATCSGTGVITCTECNGDNLLPVISLEKITNSPVKALLAYSKLSYPVDESALNSMEDPGRAESVLFREPELANIKIDEDVKKELWWEYEDWKEGRATRKTVINQKPGWETMQQVLVAEDPTGTLENPVIVKNVSYYKARKAVASEVEKMEVPPRPADWEAPLSYPLLKESDWSEEVLKNRKKREERDAILNAQAEMISKASDLAWERAWREAKIQELSKQKIESYLAGFSKRSIKKGVQKETAAEKAVDTKDTKPAAKPAKLSKEEKKKLERKERAEKLARQAAEREAALQQKKAKGK